MPTRTPDPSSLVQRVLLVDDDKVTLQTTEAALEYGGYEVWTAGSGAAALERIETQGLPHLGLFDIQMPGMTGIELAKRVQEFCDLPIIMITTVDDVSTIVHALDQFADDFITKPIEPEVLVARVRRVLRRVGDFSYVLAPTIEVGALMSRV